MLSSLKVREFRIYWIGMFISLVGTWIQTVAQSWLVFQLTQSAFLLGVVGFLSTIPIFLLSLFGGVAADRINKRKVLLVTQHAFMFLAFLLAILTQSKIVAPWHIMSIALLNGAVMAFDAPSRQAVVVELVGKENLMNAIALNSAAFNSARMIGPALAGILIVTIGTSGCFYLNAVSFLAVIIALAALRIDSKTPKGPSIFILQDLRAGLKFIGHNPIILILIFIVGITSLFGISYVILMPIFANDVLKVGVKGLATLMSASGIGALFAALILARLGDFKQKGKFLLAASLVFSISLILFSLSRVYLFSLIALALVGWSSVTAIGLINTLLQTLAPDEVRGRLMSVFMFTFAGLLPFGNLIAGSLAHVLGVSKTVMLGGMICAAFFMMINILCPDIHRI